MLVIVRHGNTFEAGVQPLRIGARTDLPLTRSGVEQARALGRHFAEQGWQFERVLTSPLRRTRQTADEVLGSQDAPPIVQMADFLREVDHGPDENKPESSIIARIGKSALDAWDRDAKVPPGWIVEPDARLSQWRKLLDGMGHLDGPTLLVTSNGAARFAILADAHLRTSAADLPSLKLPTGGYG
ncbi:MAG: histidine phosphatase family protein, partial [Alteraurantiacibacter sp.]